MATLADIKAVLPNWPNEVINEWLLYFANDIGWPPAEPLGKDRWGGILGGRPLSWWADVTWKQEQTDCSFAKLSKASQGRVQSIITDVTNKTADEVTTRRHNHALKYLMDNGVFPNHVLAMCASDGLHFVDGHHRMAAFSGLQRMPDAVLQRMNANRPAVTQTIWIGAHPKGEMPHS